MRSLAAAATTAALFFLPLARAGHAPPPAPALPAPLSASIMRLVRANAVNISTHSWEIGTLAEALTELEWGSLSVFAPGAVPPPARLARGEAEDVLEIAERIVAAKTPDTLPLIDGDGAVGDPASIGASVLLRNWTLSDKHNTTFSTAAAQQLEYLLSVAPRAPNGAISHRADQVQLWADFVYMAPPFIAYYGALQRNASLLQAAYDQVRLYRAVLFDADVGLWEHILLGNATADDPAHWGTGNAWAAAGALRVLGALQGAGKAFAAQRADLTLWVQETLDGVWRFQQANGTLLNHLDDPASFADSASTALLAASTFRLAAMTRNNTLIPAAARALRLVRASVDRDGWLTQAVDPETFFTPLVPGAHTPEGQSFVLLLEAAVAAWQAAQ
ncbi:Six-hairpin glycosidase-like protein [Gloeopeniophorella convolvens]|nr:Six-hairpin glycosidase-like protein [Gloeopeniophorella convolvens]